MYEWLDGDSGDPGFQLLSNNDIATTVASGEMKEKTPEDDDNTDDKSTAHPTPVYKDMQRLLDNFIKLVEYTNIDCNFFPGPWSFMKEHEKCCSW